MSKMLAPSPALAMKAAETRKGRGVRAGDDDGDADEERVLSAAGAGGM